MTAMADEVRDPISAEEALRIYRRLIAEADKRGGTPRGEVIAQIVDGRRLS